MSMIRRCGPILLLGGLAGCVVAPLPPQPMPLVAVPGPNKTAEAFQQDDVACRAVAGAPPQAAGAPAPAQPSAPGTAPNPSQTPAQQDATQQAATAASGIYLNCMQAHNDIVQPLAPMVYGGYAYGYAPGYAPIYGPYDGYSTYPWLYDGYPAYGFYGGWGGYWGGGWRGGWGGGGYHGGGWGGGGYHGGGGGGGGRGGH